LCADYQINAVKVELDHFLLMCAFDIAVYDMFGKFYLTSTISVPL